jgi:hypothetical protein
MQWLLALAAIGAGGYFLTRDYKEIEPVETRRGRRLPGGGRLLGITEDSIAVLEGVKKKAKKRSKSRPV